MHGCFDDLLPSHTDLVTWLDDSSLGTVRWKPFLLVLLVIFVTFYKLRTTQISSQLFISQCSSLNWCWSWTHANLLISSANFVKYIFWVLISTATFILLNCGWPCCDSWHLFLTRLFHSCFGMIDRLLWQKMYSVEYENEVSRWLEILLCHPFIHLVTIICCVYSLKAVAMWATWNTWQWTFLQS